MTAAKRTEITHTLILMLAACIWGTAFVAQSVGADHVGAFTYLAGRSWVGVAFLLPVIACADRLEKKKTGRTRAPQTPEERKLLIRGGITCGIFLTLASAAQQIGIAYTTTAKSGFLTALYVVFVPLVSIFLGKRPEKKLWICVILGVTGLYFLCMKGSEGLGAGDLWTLLCAFLFSFQILSVSHFVELTDGIRLSAWQFLTQSVIATVCMFLLEKPEPAAIRAAVPAILYAGIMSSGVAYTLQIVGQKDLNPTIASLAMCLESVFSAISGWIVLGETLSAREIFGCTLMFGAIVLSQIPVPAGRLKRERNAHAPHMERETAGRSRTGQES
jgi:drug/metabolite transporter (DMT)-like permease